MSPSSCTVLPLNRACPTSSLSATMVPPTARRTFSKRLLQSPPFPVRLYRNASRLGSTANFENAIRRCDGDVIALCDQDDVWLPEKLARLEAAFAPVLLDSSSRTPSWSTQGGSRPATGSGNGLDCMRRRDARSSKASQSMCSCLAGSSPDALSTLSHPRAAAN